MNCLALWYSAVYNLDLTIFRIWIWSCKMQVKESSRVKFMSTYGRWEISWQASPRVSVCSWMGCSAGGRSCGSCCWRSAWRRGYLPRESWRRSWLRWGPRPPGYGLGSRCGRSTGTARIWGSDPCSTFRWGRLEIAENRRGERTFKFAVESRTCVHLNAYAAFKLKMYPIQNARLGDQISYRIPKF